ncbi:hypothetical protein DESC_660060 [Desulfosarcina cetonica]|nr:hypothetical protein DESC_660060 [Desulfosarcina cetonica]
MNGDPQQVPQHQDQPQRIKQLELVTAGHVEAGQVGHAAVAARMALAAGQRILAGGHHVGDGKHIGGVNEIEFAGEGNPQGFLALGQRPVPVEGRPVPVGSGKHGTEQGFVDLVVWLLAMVDLEGKNARILVLPGTQGMAHRHDLARIDGILGGDAADGTVVPKVFRLDVLGPFELPLDGHVVVLAERVFGFIRFAVLAFSGLGPVPGHLGGVDPGERGNVAALAGNLVRVIVGLGFGFVRGAAVAGLAGDLGGQVVLDQAFAVAGRRLSVDPPGNVMQGGGMAAGTLEIATVDTHMHIQGLVGLGQRGVQIAVLDPITAAALEMAATAVLALGPDHGLYGSTDVAANLIGNRLLFRVIGSGKSGKILERLPPIDRLLTMTVEAIDGHGLLAPPGMTGEATLVLHAIRGDTEVVDRVAALAELVSLLIRVGMPGPVNGLVELISRFRVTGKAGLGHLRPGDKILLQGLEP